MSVQVRWMPYGRPSAEALRVSIAQAKGDKPLTPVTIVVSSNYVGVATRRLLASGILGPTCSRGTGLVAVNFLTPYRLAELLGAARLAGTGRKPVSTPVLAAALRAALNEDPGLFEPVSAHPATESALVDAYKELRDLSPGALDALAATGDRASEVVRLHAAARAKLEPGWYDEQDLITAAEEVLRQAPPRDFGQIIVYLPQRLSRHSASLMKTAGEQLGLKIIAGVSGSKRADNEVLDSVARISPEVTAGTTGSVKAGTTGSVKAGGEVTDAPEHIGLNSYPEDAFKTTDVAGTGKTRFVTASDADDEVRAAVRAVVDAVRQGTTLDRIAILHATPEPYAGLVHEQLNAAGIKSNGAAVAPLSARVAGRTLLQALALPENDFRRQDVFAWLAGTPLRHDGRWAPVSAWERLSREAAVVAGRQQWDLLLETYATDADEKAAQAESNPDSPDWWAERHRSEAGRARSLKTFMLGLIDDLSAASGRPKKWSEHTAWAHDFLNRTLGGPGQRRRWPEAEAKAAEKVEVALDRLAALDQVEGPVTLEIFTRTLELELDQDLGRVGRLGEGVLVGSIGMGVGLDLDLVVVVGLVEGSFPARVRDDSLLPDEEREATGGQLPLRRERVDREHRQLLATLAGAGQHLLGVPRGDLRKSSKNVASRWALDIASALAGKRLWSDDLLSGHAGWIEHVPSFSAGIKRLIFPATEQEYRLRFLSAANSEGPGALRKATDDPALSKGADAVSARRSASFTRFDGNLTGLKIPSPAGVVTSATRLQRWAECPYDYLLQEFLGVRPVQNPEDELEITPIAKGDLVHQVLERFIVEVLARPEQQQPAPAPAWSGRDRERITQIAREVFEEFSSHGRTGRPIFWQRDSRRILRDLQKILDADDHHRSHHKTRPIAAELPFGLAGRGGEPVALGLDDGRAVRFRGLADRLDAGEDGALHVLDYKTGSADGYRGLSEQDPDLRGTRLQLPVYAAAARQHAGRRDAPVLAEYFFASSKGGFKHVGYWVTPEAMQRVGRTLTSIVAGIEAGIFPNYTTATSTDVFVQCDSCDPDALGVADLRRGWDRKSRDPAMKVFVSLVEAAQDGHGR